MGWLFGNKDNSRTETKTVNDNGKLKELQLTITGPDSTMVVTGDEYRTTVPLRGNQPVAAEEVSIERKAPNGMWLNSLIPFYDGDVKGTQKKARSLWQLPAVEGKSQGGWMNKFQNGGSTQPTQDQAMKELMAIVQQAATELQSNKPGQGVQTLAQIANDPQGSQLLDVLVQQVPEAGQIVEAVMKMVGAYKCGGKAKKKVKKGAKGCVPCKKLMKVGGKLINVWSDCEGRIISKHQAGGWLIPKGAVGLTAQFVQEPYRKAKLATDEGTAGDIHYSVGDDGKIYSQTYGDSGWGNRMLADMNTFKNWVTTPTAEGDILGKNFFINGFNYDYTTGMGTMSESDAQAAGIDGSKYNTAGKVINGVQGQGGNDLYGIEAKDPTKLDVINQRGLSYVLNNTFRLQQAANLKAKSDFKTARRSILRDPKLWGEGYLKKEREIKNTAIKNNNIEASKDRAAWLQAHADASSQTPTTTKVPTYTPNSTPGTAATGYQSTSAQYKKQGGWLTKFQDGGHMDYETKSNTSGTTWEQRIDRDNTGATYRYNPGRTSHVVTLQTTGLPTINPTRFVKYGEERYYITDPKTGRVMKIEGPTIDQRIEEVAPVAPSQIIEDQITPEQDIFIFPGGFTKVVPAPTPSNKPKPKQGSKPKQEVEWPKQEVPALPNDNTSTSGSKTPGNIRQGNYPHHESIPAPEGYNPADEWVEERDQVNGQVRITWRNKKTGEIRRVKPYKYGGWLNKFN